MSVKDKISEDAFAIVLNSAVKYQELLGIIFGNSKYNNHKISFDDQAIENFLKEKEPDKFYYLITRSIPYEKDC